MAITHLIFLVFGILAFSCLLSLFNSQWLALKEAMFRMIMSPVAIGENSLQRFWTGLRGFFRGQFADEEGNLNLNTVFINFWVPVSIRHHSACSCLRIFICCV